MSQGLRKLSLERKYLQLASGLTVAVTVFLTAGTSAWAKNGAVEFAKYFNPIQKKGYTNESQDRIIKKRAFKSDSVQDVEAAVNKEIGVFASINSEDVVKDDLIEDLLSRPNVNGISVILPWQQLEPADEEFNWQPIDRLLELAGKHDKSLILRVSTCGLDLPTTGSGLPGGTSPERPEASSDTPKWVFDAGVKSLSYTGADGKAHQMPIFWDSTYLANWRNFVKALGKRYDKNPAIHSVGITGGGIRGGTAVVPWFGKAGESDSPARNLEQKLKTEFGMSQRQIVEHWKYVADLFPKSFETARLNFDVDPPTAGRKGQDELDEISDYLVYRYGERVYLTRENISNAKHGFDQYRVLLKFRGDTLTGYQLSPDIAADALKKLSQSALDDGISFAEVPAALVVSKDESIADPLKHLASHIGYEIVTQKASIPSEVKSGEPLKASFAFLNLGAAAPLRPDRNLDKDVASSYRIMIELRDTKGKPVVLSLHTPPTPTNQWLAGKPVTYDEELKMPKLPAGEYSVYMWLIDGESKRKLQLLDAISHEKPTPTNSVPLGKLKVLGDGQALGSTGPSPQ